MTARPDARPAGPSLLRRLLGRWRRRIACSACGGLRSAERRVIAGPKVYLCEHCLMAAVRVATQGAAVDPSGCAFCFTECVPSIALGQSRFRVCLQCLDVARVMLARTATPPETA